MENLGEQDKRENKASELSTFAVPVDLEELQEDFVIESNIFSMLSKEQIINKALKFHSQGNTLEAAKYYKYLIDQGLNDYMVFSNYGSILKGNGKLTEAEKAQRKAIELNPTFAQAYSNLGNILKDQGKLEEAEKAQRKAIELNPTFAQAYSNLGAVLEDKGELEEAEKAQRKAIELNPTFAQAYSNLGNILKDQGKLEEAEKAQRKAIELNPDFAQGYSNLGAVLRDLGKLKEAEKAQKKAIKLDPDFAHAHYNLGLIFNDQGNFTESEISLRKVIELKPDYADTYLNLGIILRDQGKSKEAKISLLKAIELNPQSAESHAILGLTLLYGGEYERSLKHFSESAALVRGGKVQDFNHKRFTTISQAKIEHDIEQFQYLVSQGYETEKFKKLVYIYKKIFAEVNWPSETELISLDQKYQCLVKSSYNRLIHRIKAPILYKGVVNNSLNVKQITNDYFNSEIECTYIDEFLCPSALESLRNFLLLSTIWFEIKKNGYLGAYLKEGLANPLLLQIADTLRKKFPKIFKDYPIYQIWAYKYDSRAKNQSSLLGGINVHADFAAVNVNFWITPSEASLNPDSGGLIVYDVEAPKEWNFNTYNNDERKIRKELKKSKGKTKVIPYRGNRAVVFNSKLFHETDTYEFKDGYDNRRINVTMLFGIRN